MTRTLSPAEFQRMVDDAWDALPAQFRDRLDNVAISVEELADPYTLSMAGVRHPYELLGFYHGVPLTERTHDYGMVAPDRISLYRRPILAQSRTAEQAAALVGR
ncbi:MAG: metallopeptidase family protein, partial [Rudaea sp.]